MSIIKSNMTAPPPPTGGALSSIGEMNSLRYHPSIGSINYTLQNAGHSTDHTISVWLKLCGFDTTFQEVIQLAVEPTTSRAFHLNEGKIKFSVGGGATIGSKGVLRDFSAWYHVVGSRSASESKLWLNGVLQETASVTGTSDFATQGIKMSIGKGILNNYMNAWPLLSTTYFSDLNYVDGIALPPTAFGEEISGVWVPKAYSGAYGANGFHLDFADSGNIGNDVSGNGNHWTVN